MSYIKLVFPKSKRLPQKDRDILLRAADHLAEKLEVAEEYEQFKDVDFLKPPETPFSETGEWECRSNDIIDQKS